MTTLEFERRDGRITGVHCHGHSNFSDSGTDIVCAAVTSVIRLVECTLNDILGLGVKAVIENDNAAITLELPSGLSSQDEETAQALLAGLMLYMVELQEEFPKNILVMEV